MDKAGWKTGREEEEVVDEFGWKRGRGREEEKVRDEAGWTPG